MKILLVNTFDLYGGAARAAYRLFQGFRRIGSDCTMMVGRKHGDDAHVRALGPVTPAETARMRFLEAEIRQEMAAYPVLAGGNGSDTYHSERAAPGEILVRQLPPADVINLHWVRGFVDYTAFFGSRPPGQPVVWTLHDMKAFTGGCHYDGGCTRFTLACGACPRLNSDDPDDLSARVLRRQAAALKGTSARLHVVTPSRWLADRAKASALFADIPVSVIPYSLETDIYRPFEKAEARAQFNLPPDRRIILFAAHVLTDPRKGLAQLDEALCRLPPQEGLALLTVGLGNPHVKAPVQRFHMDFIADKARYEAVMSRLYAVADVVAVPSQEDNLPNLALEAMSAGRPVVAFANGGLPELVENGRTGFLARSGDVEELAALLAAALSDPDRLAAMGRAARDRIERENALEVQAGRYRDLFQTLLRPSPSGP